MRPSRKEHFSFGERLKARRLALGLSQYELADITGITNMQISRYESGMQNATVKTLEALAKALGVSADWLLGLTDYNPDGLSEKEWEILRLFRSKPPERQDTAIEVMRVL